MVRRSFPYSGRRPAGSHRCVTQTVDVGRFRPLSGPARDADTVMVCDGQRASAGPSALSRLGSLRISSLARSQAR
jgi:hypothetical protein